MEDDEVTTAESSETQVDLGRTNEFPASSVSGGFGSSVGGGGGGGSNGAKYKLMSPAKLPISRSPCLTIPPGLSPTSFLESPVLLSNMKAEPSPTTGSFLNPQMMHFLSTASCSNTNTFDERNSNSFEFKPHNGSKFGSGIPSVRPMISADINHQQSECFLGIGGQGQYQSFPSSPSMKNEAAVSSNDLSLSASAKMVPPKDSVPAEVNCNEIDHRGQHTEKIQGLQSDHKGIAPSIATERSDDGYNWRKYGQKLVKGSEFPRSYYKCTHPNCYVKKLFERSYEGQITEIVYKGAHNHPKPQPSRRFSSGTTMPIQEDTPDKVLSLTSQDDESSNPYGQIARNLEPNDALELSPVATNVESVEAALQDEIDDDDPFSKRRRMEIGGIDVTPVVKPIREPRVVVQTLSEVDILDDGYRWRKYGQKVVRGNPNPRSYYKCTNAGCPVRKHVERASHDPKAVITTYEGKHNHDVPTAKNSSHETPGSMAINGVSRIRREECDTISLDLGVGISSAAENRSNEQHQTLQVGLDQSQMHGVSNIMVPHPTPFSTYYGVLSGGPNQYGSRQIRDEGHSFETPPLNHSSQPYPQNTGRIVMGP